MLGPSKNLNAQLKSLEVHLREENPMLVQVVDGYRKLSRVGYAMGLLTEDESYATQISWWPLISVLGTFSAGKSTFINQHLGYPLQDTGNQAVDDKFTMICYGAEEESRTLPGLALDADPRFPFYQTSEELEQVAPGEGRRVDAYLQLKTCSSSALKGRIFIDSPGFDADAQRSATLRLTNHIVDLSDLVLVLFDARHPEPGAMSDTLAHLVRGTIDRADSSKFLYILNQIDTTAREDNPEKVIGAWQRALAREGLTAGRFYCIYDPDASVPIDDVALRRRFEWKREQDMDDIVKRIEQVSVERSYRVIGGLEKRAQEIEEHYVPRLRALVGQWRRKVLQAELGLLALFTAAVTGLAMAPIRYPAWLQELWQGLLSSNEAQMGAAGLAAAGLLYSHFLIRRRVAKVVDRGLIASTEIAEERERLRRAFARNTRFARSIFEPEPAGWNLWNRRRLRRITSDADRYVQELNDRFTDPSGKRIPPYIPKAENTEAEGSAMTGEVITRSSSA